ncbi:MAG: ligase-associated DNA damage response DEXH box helicase [Planctomycetota bacterium]
MTLKLASDWMKESGRKPFPFQRAVWKSMLDGKSGLLHSPTGTGKTLAIWMGAIARWHQALEKPLADNVEESKRRRINRNAADPIRVLWLTPLRALAADTLLALQQPADQLKLPWTVERRTSDSSSTMKTKQKDRLPTCLITTPESLSILLSYKKTHHQFKTLDLVVLDEWHELMSSKRGVQAELGLARLRTLSPNLLTWAVSATIGNVDKAMQTALGQGGDQGVIVKAPARRKLSMKSVIPEKIERFPWAGHMGLKSVPAVVDVIDTVGSSLVFTNTRSQAERWYSAILHARPDWAVKIDVHHGSLERKKRQWVERELDAGKLKCVVCTSSLDLGVDFFPVEQVLQIGSPKGIARLMQRAGRSGHYPGGKSQLVFVPTNALELVELAAAKDALKKNRIEDRNPIMGCLDLLAQHVVSIACGSPFNESELFEEVKRTHAFRWLAEVQWQWVLDFVRQGGESLKAYPDFAKVVIENDEFHIKDARTARLHRMSIGTIPSDQEIQVRYMKGGRLGTIEERFISRLKPGDKFMFAGRTLKLVMTRDMTAWVRRAKGQVAALPRWHGGRLPLSSELSAAVREKLSDAKQGKFTGPEMRAIKPLLKVQSQWSTIPDEHMLLIEKVKTRDGFHVFIYPFEGRLVHEGLAAVIAWRLGQLQPITFATTINDYGIELLSPTEPPIEMAVEKGLFSSVDLVNQIEKCMNAGELDRRQFRDIARVAGLVQGGFPGQGKSAKQLQASSDLFFEVFKEYEPDNMLLRQARQEVLEYQLQQQRLTDALDRISACEVVIHHPPKPTPLAFPILVDRLKMKMSSEKLADRIERLAKQYESVADQQGAGV